MAFTKIITPGSQDFHEPVAQLIKFSSRGLHGNDLDAFIKRASVQFVDKIAGMRFGPGEEPVHLLAVGATETYGPNRNGDGFKKATCQQYHPTFVKLARWYRDHNNKDTRKGRGIIKASDYNPKMHRIELIVALNVTKEAADRNRGLVADEEMEKLAKGEDIPVSMACRVSHDICLMGGTLVETVAGLQPIETVQVGDTVRTQQGNWQTVSQTFCRPFTGTAVRLDVFGIPEQISMTHNHPVWVLKQAAIRQCYGSVKGKRRRHTVRDGQTCVMCKADVLLDFQWCNAVDVAAGDYVAYPVRLPGARTIGSSKAYFLGRYIGAGCLLMQKRGRKRDGEAYARGAAISTASNDPSLQHIVDAATNILGRKPSVTPDRDALRVSAYSVPLATDIERMIGTGSHKKQCNAEIFDLCEEDRLALLAGWLDSDGHVDDMDRGRICTVSRQLADDCQKLFWGLGIPAAIHKETHKSGYSNKPVEVYVVFISRTAVARLAPYSYKARNTVPSKKQHAKAFLLHGYMLLPVQRIVQAYEEADVFNIAVEYDETYIAGFAIHNCSGCGNHARTRKDYCGPETCTKYGGLRDNMAKTFEDGHILHADNPDPAFFDISKVFRNADRIAFTLGRAKAAADFHAACDDATAVPGEARGGAAIAERLGVSPPIWLLTDGPWSDPRIVGQLKIAQELIQMEDKLADSVPAALDRAFERSVQPVRGGLPEGPFKLAHVITALADARCMLPLPTFIAIMAGESTEKAAAIADAVAPRLAGVYNRLASDPRLEEDLRQNPYLPQNQAPRRLRHWALKYANEWSLDRPRVVERLQLSVLRQPRPNQRRQPMAKIATTAKTDEMAKEYALYQLGLLQHLASQPEADFRHELAIRSNFLQ